jgi:hypothetical protein
MVRRLPPALYAPRIGQQSRIEAPEACSLSAGPSRRCGPSIVKICCEHRDLRTDEDDGLRACMHAPATRIVRPRRQELCADEGHTPAPAPVHRPLSATRASRTGANRGDTVAEAATARTRQRCVAEKQHPRVPAAPSFRAGERAAGFLAGVEQVCPPLPLLLDHANASSGHVMSSWPGSWRPDPGRLAWDGGNLQNCARRCSACSGNSARCAGASPRARRRRG